MFYTQQRNKSDCVIACISTLIQVPYDELVVHFNPRYRDVGIGSRDVARVLAMYDYSARIIKEAGKQINLSGEPAIVSVDSLNNKGHTHAIFWDGYNIFDPSRFKVYDEMPKEIYKVIFVAEPTPWREKILFHNANKQKE